MPQTVSSIRFRALLALGTVLFFALLWWITASTQAQARSARLQRPLPPTQPSPLHPPNHERIERLAAVDVGRASREEIVRYVTAAYRKEQLTRELDLEQRRFAKNYWAPDCDGRDLARIRAARAALIAELANEANAVLASVLPREQVPSIALTPFFDDDRVGPNLSFLPTESRQRFETALLSSGSFGPQTLADVADVTLRPSERTQYHAWNDPANAALRNELLGFDATESEFLAIRDARANGDGEKIGAPEGLEKQLGSDRYAQWLQLESPAMRTATHELHRFGLPLANATWLASTREAAAAEIQQIWQDKALSTATKSDRVSLLQRELGQAIAAKLSLPGSDLDE